MSCAPRADNRSATIAVAANFKPAIEDLIVAFEDETEFELDLVIGSTGKLYAQIVYGAPYDVFLAADQWRPQRLIADGDAEADSQITYAIGRLVLWSHDHAPVNIERLSDPDIQHIAIANPDLAPYGTAARQVLRRTETLDAVQDKLVLGESVGQAFAFVSTANAQIGFVSEAQVLSLPAPERNNFIRIEADLHDPIAQDAVLLKAGQDNPAAEQFLVFLQSAKAQDIIAQHGYDLP